MGCNTVINRTPGSTYHFSEVNHFLKLTTSKSYPEITRWEGAMIIGVFGSPSIEDEEMIHQVAVEINELIGPNKILRIQDQANVEICFVSFEEMKKLRTDPDDLSWVSINYWRNEDGSLARVRILISDRLLSRDTRDGTIRSLITAALGFRKSLDRPGSFVFTKFIGDMASSYSESDKEMIKLLYHDQLISGMERGFLRKRIKELKRK